MKVDTDALGVFHVSVPLSEVNDWLMDSGVDLVEVNSAIDLAASWTGDSHDSAFVVIEINRQKRA